MSTRRGAVLTADRQATIEERPLPDWFNALYPQNELPFANHFLDLGAQLGHFL